MCCPPVYVVASLHLVGGSGVSYITCDHFSFEFTDPGLQVSSCFTNVDLIALCTRDMVHHTMSMCFCGPYTLVSGLGVQKTLCCIMVFLQMSAILAEVP